MVGVACFNFDPPTYLATNHAPQAFSPSHEVGAVLVIASRVKVTVVAEDPDLDDLVFYWRDDDGLLDTAVLQYSEWTDDDGNAREEWISSLELFADPALDGKTLEVQVRDRNVQPKTVTLSWTLEVP
jgi:hypothetical protein